MTPSLHGATEREEGGGGVSVVAEVVVAQGR